MSSLNVPNVRRFFFNLTGLRLQTLRTEEPKNLVPLCHEFPVQRCNTPERDSLLWKLQVWSYPQKDSCQYIYENTVIYICIRIYVYVYICTVDMYICIYVYMYVCTYVWLYNIQGTIGCTTSSVAMVFIVFWRFLGIITHKYPLLRLI